MAYDDLKRHAGRAYSGMPVGGVHEWTYPEGHWWERKTAPDKWDVRFSSLKRRARPAPVDSGARPGTAFHWLLVAHQRVVKLDQDTYETLLEGTKWKVAHKRPHWRQWSSQYPGQASARARVIEALEQTLAELRAEEEVHRLPIEETLEPVKGLEA